ncbi:MAG TPA: hypothetical protein VLG28_16285 [Acidimicrobiia bacterium]|jgi:hypothetical protein|nr:hypothetical protein [Acidimicrobiia bacterium]
MAVAVQAEVTAVAEVVRASVAHYGKRHEAVVESWLAEMAGAPVTDALGFLSCVVAFDRRIIEIVVPSAAEASGLSAVVWSLAASGWHVTVLAPAAGMGSAHVALRGTPCRLQSWWHEDGEVVFGRYERP